MMNGRDEHRLCLKDILKPLIEEIENIENDYTHDAGAYYESKAAYIELLEFLKYHSNSTQSISIPSLKPFSDILSKRWYQIKRTPGSYFVNSYSLANQAYFRLATCLAKYLGISVWVLLMPTVNFISYIENSAKSKDFHLFALMLIGEENPLDILKCLDDAATRKSLVLFNTCGVKRQLNEEDKFRVITHSIEATNYFKAIELYIQNGDNKELLIARSAFVTAIKSNTYRVNNLSDLEGSKHLVSCTISRLKTREDFINTFVFSPKPMWISCLNKINKVDFKKYILDKGQLSDEVKQGYNGNLEHDKFLLYCYLEVYWHDREELDKYTSPLGWLADYSNKYIGGYSKDEKEAAVILMQVFLTSNYDLNEFDLFLNQLKRKDIEDFLKMKFEIKNPNLQIEKMRKVSEIANLIEMDKQNIVYALHAGSLSMFTQQMKLLCSLRNNRMLSKDEQVVVSQRKCF